MKANRKFLRDEDEAVSPVIAVILMVAITVVLAATVYVWVSGFNTGGGAARTMSLSSAGVLASDTKTYVVASVSPGLKWDEVDFSLDGTKLDYANPPTAAGEFEYCVILEGADCNATEPAAVINAGERIKVADTGLSGQTLRMIDASSNSIMGTLVVS